MSFAFERPLIIDQGFRQDTTWMSTIFLWWPCSLFSIKFFVIHIHKCSVATWNSVTIFEHQQIKFMPPGPRCPRITFNSTDSSADRRFFSRSPFSDGGYWWLYTLLMPPILFNEVQLAMGFQHEENFKSLLWHKISSAKSCSAKSVNYIGHDANSRLLHQQGIWNSYIQHWVARCHSSANWLTWVRRFLRRPKHRN